MDTCIAVFDCSAHFKYKTLLKETNYPGSIGNPTREKERNTECWKAERKNVSKAFELHSRESRFMNSS